MVGDPMSQPELIYLLIIGGITLMVMVVGAGLLSRRDERRRKGPEPWIGYTYSFMDGPEAGGRYRIKSVQQGFVVLEKLEE